MIRGSGALSLSYKNTVLLLRGNYYYDIQYEQEPEPPAGSVKDLFFTHLAILDVFVYYYGSDEQVNIQLGKQVIILGENTFIQDVLNDINTLGISQLGGSMIPSEFAAIDKLLYVAHSEAFACLKISELEP